MHRSLCLLSTAGLLTMVFGCASAGESEAAGDAVEVSQERVVATLAPLASDFAVSVVPTGSGCPAGTWTGDISPGGLSFTVAFSAYELSVSPRTMTSPGSEKAEAECKLTITFNPTSDVQYSVGEFAVSGYAYLEPGVKARVVTSYKFSNTPERIKEHKELEAPSPTQAYDQDFLLTDDAIALPDGEWTKCRKRELLKLNTRMVVKNPMAKKSGYIVLAAIDGELTVRVRPCAP
jgi:hypothetical protein